MTRVCSISQRYLENQIREVFGLTGTPVRMVIRERSDKSQ